MVTKAANPMHRWMIERNVGYAATEGSAVVVARLRAGGYHHVANEVERRTR